MFINNLVHCLASCIVFLLSSHKIGSIYYCTSHRGFKYKYTSQVTSDYAKLFSTSALSSPSIAANCQNQTSASQDTVARNDAQSGRLLGGAPLPRIEVACPASLHSLTTGSTAASGQSRNSKSGLREVGSSQVSDRTEVIAPAPTC